MRRFRRVGIERLEPDSIGSLPHTFAVRATVINSKVDSQKIKSRWRGPGHDEAVGRCRAVDSRRQGGSSEALGEALEACRHYLLGIAAREFETGLLAKAGASDIVQETLLEAQRDFPDFAGLSEDELLAWLRRLLLNNLANFRRYYRSTDKRKVDRERSIGFDESGTSPPTEIAANAATPSVLMMADEQTRDLLLALQRLPDDQRQVLQLRYLDERSFEEIAEIMGRTSNAARKLWGRAVERLQEEMDAAP